MLSLPSYHLLLLVHARPLVSVAVSGDRHSVSYSPLGSTRGGPGPSLLFGRSMLRARPVHHNPYPHVSVLKGVRHRCHSPAPSGQSERKL
jgi:hypothetical protein